MRVSDIIATSWMIVLALTIMLVLKLVGRVRVSGGIAASGRKWRKTTSQPVAIPLLMFVALVVVTVVLALVFKVVRGLGVIGITTAIGRKLGKIPLIMLTLMLVLEVVRGLRVSVIISASRG